MANPQILTTTKDQWTKIATNVVTGQIHKLTTTPILYLQTYRETGDAAPIDGNEGIPIFLEGITEKISAQTGIDVYIYSQKNDGKVRVDV